MMMGCRPGPGCAWAFAVGLDRSFTVLWRFSKLDFDLEDEAAGSARMRMPMPKRLPQPDDPDRRTSSPTDDRGVREHYHERNHQGLGHATAQAVILLKRGAESRAVYWCFAPRLNDATTGLDRNSVQELYLSTVRARSSADRAPAS
jgi:hypothetical protein